MRKSKPLGVISTSKEKNVSEIYLDEELHELFVVSLIVVTLSCLSQNRMVIATRSTVLRAEMELWERKKGDHFMVSSLGIYIAPYHALLKWYNINEINTNIWRLKIQQYIVWILSLKKDTHNSAMLNIGKQNLTLFFPIFWTSNMHLNDIIGLYISTILQVHEEHIHVMLVVYTMSILEASGDHATYVLCVHSYQSELIYEQHSFEFVAIFFNILSGKPYRGTLL